MPYAVYSKRTGVFNRIIHDLSTLLPSESVLEVDDDVSFPRSTPMNILGHRINTFGIKLYDRGGGVPTVKPFEKQYDGDGKPSISAFEPLFIQITDDAGNPKKGRVDLPFYVNPFSWKLDELARAKYEAILSKNYPYQVVIGEEFINTDHIDTSASSGYTLTEGMCILSPSGILESSWLKFNAVKNVDAVVENVSKQYTRFVMDTLYFATEPDLPEGVKIYWKGTKWSDDSETAWEDFVTDEEVATVEDGEASATLLNSIKIRVTNLTTNSFELENYMLFLRLRNMHA